jgi:hypothetical protein
MHVIVRRRRQYTMQKATINTLFGALFLACFTSVVGDFLVFMLACKNRFVGSNLLFFLSQNTINELTNNNDNNNNR